MTRARVAFLADYFCTWMGGASLFASLLDCARAAADRMGVEVVVLMHARQLPAELAREASPVLRLPAAAIEAQGPLACLLQGARLDEIVFYDDLAAACDALRVDVIGPSGTDLGADFPRPWFAYVPDFQHQYLPAFFSPQERAGRDRHFRGLVENAAGVFVNAGTVAADIDRFYPGGARRGRLLRLPMLLPRLDDIADANATARRHGLQRPFFLSCSQRWLHKQHPLILEAFADFVELNPHLPVELVFTGETSDWRDPGHAARVDRAIEQLGLGGRVRVLGLVPRAEQLALVRLAMAVVQASLFEGGPGASGTMEAALLGTRVIASDIAPNRELGLGRLRFFDARSASALSREMSMVVREVADGPPGARGGLAPFDAAQVDAIALAGGLQLLGTLVSAAGEGA